MAVEPQDRSRRRAPGAASLHGEPGRAGAAENAPPAPLASFLAAGGDLLVLTTDAQLADTVQRATREQFPLRIVASSGELDEALLAARRAVVLVDADALGDALRARINALAAGPHKVVVLLAAGRPAAENVMGLLSERKIHRLLIKPAAPGITRLLIDSAVNRCLQLGDVADLPPVDAPPPERALRARPGAAVPVWVVGSAVAALLLGVALVGGVSAWLRPAADGDASPLTALVPATTVAAAEIALAAQPADQAARGPLDGTLNLLFADAEAALLADDHSAAADALAEIRRADPNNSRLVFLEAQLERAKLATASAPRAIGTQLAADASGMPNIDAEVASLLTIARARIQRGQLLEPAAESASEYFDRARALAPDGTEVAQVRTELAAALVTAARAALARNQLERSAALATGAHRRRAEPEALAELDTGLARLRARRAAQRHADWLELADRRVGEGALVEPEGDSARDYLLKLQAEGADDARAAAVWAAFEAAATAKIESALDAGDWSAAERALAALQGSPGGDNAALRVRFEVGKLAEHYLAVAIPAGDLELVERAAPQYPAGASRNGIEGWVDTEFVVDETGRPGEFVVVAAEPQGAFEEAALAALREYRYRPFVAQGRPFARRVRLRIRFALE